MTSIPVSTPSVAPATTATVQKEFDLPSGKKCALLRGNGKDLRMALMAAGPKADQYQILRAIIARRVLVDGKKITMESIDEMDFDDAFVLDEEVGQILRPLARQARRAAVQS